MFLCKENKLHLNNENILINYYDLNIWSQKKKKDTHIVQKACIFLFSCGFANMQCTSLPTF